jgi:hypothetical protein
MAMSSDALALVLRRRSAFGEVVSVRLARWNHTQSLKGFGYVQFRSGEGAEAAMAAPSIEVTLTLTPRAVQCWMASAA